MSTLYEDKTTGRAITVNFDIEWMDDIWGVPHLTEEPVPAPDSRVTPRIEKQAKYLIWDEKLFCPSYPLIQHLRETEAHVDRMAQHITDLIENDDTKYDWVVLSVQGTSGAIIGSLLHLNLSKRLIPVSIQQIAKGKGMEGHHRSKVEMSDIDNDRHGLKNPLNLFVDDFIDTGSTFNRVREGVEESWVGKTEINGICVMGAVEPKHYEHPEIEVVIAHAPHDADADPAFPF